MLLITCGIAEELGYTRQNYRIGLIYLLTSCYVSLSLYAYWLMNKFPENTPGAENEDNPYTRRE